MGLAENGDRPSGVKTVSGLSDEYYGAVMSGVSRVSRVSGVKKISGRLEKIKVVHWVYLVALLHLSYGEQKVECESRAQMTTCTTVDKTRPAKEKAIQQIEGDDEKVVTSPTGRHSISRSNTPRRGKAFGWPRYLEMNKKEFDKTIKCVTY